MYIMVCFMLNIMNECILYMFLNPYPFQIFIATVITLKCLELDLQIIISTTEIMDYRQLITKLEFKITSIYSMSKL